MSDISHSVHRMTTTCETTEHTEPTYTGRRVLLYLGGADGHGVDNLLMQNNYHSFTEVHVFEAQKESYEKLRERYKLIPQIVVNYGAVVPRQVIKGEMVDFHVCAANGSSSLGSSFDSTWEGQFVMKERRQVPAINVLQYCMEHGIETVDTYLSDLQGIDLEVLSTMAPMIQTGKIRQIQCEVAKNGKRNIYADLPSNEQHRFDALLGQKYRQSSIGWVSGLLPPDFNVAIPVSWWEFDCLWVRK